MASLEMLAKKYDNKYSMAEIQKKKKIKQDVLEVKRLIKQKKENLIKEKKAVQQKKIRDKQHQRVATQKSNRASSFFRSAIATDSSSKEKMKAKRKHKEFSSKLRSLL